MSDMKPIAHESVEIKTQTLFFDSRWNAVAEPESLLDWVNSVRKALGHDPIEALVPSYRSDCEACLIANAFNHETNLKAVVEAVSRQYGIGIVYFGVENPEDPEIDMPAAINNAALAFDKGLYLAELAIDLHSGHQ